MLKCLAQCIAGTIAWRRLIIFAFSTLVSVTVLGQGTGGQNAAGTKPFWTYLKAREVISPASGNVMVEIPILHLPGRNGHDVNLSYTYNSAGQLSIGVYPGCVPGPTCQGAAATLAWVYNQTWNLNLPGMYAVNVGPLGATNPLNSTYCNTGRVVNGTGATYTFGMATWNCGDHANHTYAYLDNPIAGDDGLTGVILDASAPLGVTAYFPDGHRLVSTTTSQGYADTRDIDSNGNYIDYVGGTEIIDTLGRVITGVNPVYPGTIQYYDSAGKPQSITFSYGAQPKDPTSVTLPPPPISGLNMGACGNGCLQWSSSAMNNSQFGVSSIVFPDGSSYVFQYNAVGNLIKVGYPDGGYTRYDYAPFQRSYYLGTTPGVPGATTGVQYQIIAKHTCSSDQGIPFGTTVMPVPVPANFEANNTCSTNEITTTYAPTSQGTYSIHNTGSVVTEGIVPGSTANNKITTYSFLYNYPASSYLLGTTAQTSITDQTPVELSHTTTDAAGNILEQVTNTYESDNLHLKTQTITRQYGVSEAYVYSIVSTPLTYGGVQVQAAGGQNATFWTTSSKATLVGGTEVRREDYTWNSPGFDPSKPFFAGLKLSDKLYDDALGAYSSQSAYTYGDTVTSSGVISQHLSVASNRGNQTSETHWSSADNAYIGTVKTFDDTGNVLSSTDPLGHTTSFSYADAFVDQNCLSTGGGPTAAYPTLVTNVLGQKASVEYNRCTGTKASMLDANNQTTSYTYYSTDQLSSVTYPDGGITSFCYDNTLPCAGTDSLHRNFIVSTESMAPDPTVVKEDDFDGLDRVIASRVMSDPCRSETDTTYDSMERVFTTTAPYFSLTSNVSCAAQAQALTTYLYNPLGHPSSLQVQGRAPRTWTYASQTETETDEVGNQTQRTLDALGRLVTVREPTSGLITLETDYQYNAADDLTQVDQWGGAKGNVGDRQRTFVYDTLSRLTASTNPEAGTISYTYDKDGDLLVTKDARGITSTRSYDPLNRLTETLYSDGTPSECFYYDSSDNGSGGGYQSYNSNPVGRLTAEWTQTGTCQTFGLSSGSGALTLRIIGGPAGGTSTAGYDSMGRLVSDMQCPASPCPTLYSNQYSYDKGGRLDTQGVSGTPTGTVWLNHSYDAGGREATLLSSWSDPSHPATLFQANTWSPCGSLPHSWASSVLLQP